MSFVRASLLLLVWTLLVCSVDGIAGSQLESSSDATLTVRADSLPPPTESRRSVTHQGPTRRTFRSNSNQTAGKHATPSAKDIARLRQVQSESRGTRNTFSSRATTVAAVTQSESVFEFNSFLPSDCTSDVDNNFMVAGINMNGGVEMKIFLKDDLTTTTANFVLDGLAPDGSLCKTNAGGDPQIIWDGEANRWLILEFLGHGLNGLCLYVSQTEDPNADYFFYFFETPAFPDYMKLASSGSDAYFMGTNEDDGESATPAIYAIDKPAAIGGMNTKILRVVLDALPYSFQVLQPAQNVGSETPFANSQGLFFRHFDDELDEDNTPNPMFDFLEIWKADADFSTDSLIVTQAYSIPISEFDLNLCKDPQGSTECVPQPGTSQRLDAVSTVVMQRVQYRREGMIETIALAFTAPKNNDGLTAVRWIELRNSGSGYELLHEDELSDNEGLSRFMPAIARDANENLAVIYTVSSETAFPGLRVSYRFGDGPEMDGETIIEAGFGSQEFSEGSGGRWGDYFALSSDPSIPGIFWGVGMFIPTSVGEWQVRGFEIRIAEVPDGLSPTSGSELGGTVVTITGSDIEAATSVTFGPNAAVRFIQVSATQLRAVSPMGTAGTVVDVVVTTAGATITAGQFTYVIGCNTVFLRRVLDGEQAACSA